MCGIVGYVGDKESAPILVSGLKKIEYRGYDSAGVAVVANNQLNVVRATGKLRNLEAKVVSEPPSGFLGIGHTRWATHGRPLTRTRTRTATTGWRWCTTASSRTTCS